MENLRDVNAIVAGFLRDLAFAQTSKQKMFGYKRAAAAVVSLERQLDELLRENGALPKIPGVGPASSRVILEVLSGGGSPTVDRVLDAIDSASRKADVQRRRGLRSHFLSRAAVLRVLHDTSLATPTLRDYHGDLQMHSEWSDGSPTLTDIVDAGIDLGWQFAAVTDHSHGLKIAGGMTMDDVARQHREIDRINKARGSSFRLIKGIEANIGADGQLDLSNQEAAQFELVLAAPHSKLRLDLDQTPRMLRALETPGVRILAHPRGRVGGSRGGVIADWDRVFRAAKEADVAIEIDGDPARQDLDYTLARRAREIGCLFALDSDAHTTDQFRYVETAIAHARLASIPLERIVNCWERDRLLKWLRSG